jgi:anti-anti-sigma factor
MKIEIAKEDSICYITVKDTIGMFERDHALEVEKKIKKCLEDGLKDMAVDFSSVAIMNSAAISRLISMIRYIQDANGRLAFWGLSEDLLQILNFVNIPNFAIANSKEGAKELFI